MPVVPGAFLFRYKFTLLNNSRIPLRGKNRLNLSTDYMLPALTELGDQIPFGQIRMAWNEQGLGLCLEVQGKKHPPVADLAHQKQSDSLQLFFDTRDTQTIHRASRYCHHFTLFPSAESGKKLRTEIVQHRIPNAKADAPEVGLANILTATQLQKQGYKLEAWFPAETLHGFDPKNSPRLGFFYHLHDTELGDQYLTINQEFPFAQDPSLWSTLELSDETV